MNVAWIHDHQFFTDGLNYYSRGSMPSSVWERYLLEDCNLYVFGRKLQEKSNILSSYSGVQFVLSNYYSNFTSFIKNYFKIVKELDRFLSDKDKVIIRLPSVLGLLACNIVKKRKIPYMLEVVGCAYDSFNSYGNIVGKILANPYDFIMKKRVQEASHVLYVTQEYLQALYPNNKGITVACTNAMVSPVEESVLQTRIERIKSRKAGDPFVIGQIGNLSVSYKGYSVAIEALAHLKKQNIKVEFRVGGNGSPDAILKQAKQLNVEDCIKILGPIPHEEIHLFYDAIDCYIHPSLLEGLPRVCVEAISRGCPCATSKAGGTPELINKLHLHNIGDSLKLAEDIRLLSSNRKMLTDAAVENFQKAKLYYSTITSTKRKDFIENFYKS